MPHTAPVAEKIVLKRRLRKSPHNERRRLKGSSEAGSEYSVCERNTTKVLRFHGTWMSRKCADAKASRTRSRSQIANRQGCSDESLRKSHTSLLQCGTTISSRPHTDTGR